MPANSRTLPCGSILLACSTSKIQETTVTREAAKLLKRSCEMAQDPAQLREATVALLRHSLRLGHRRLSLRRLEAAVSCGADLTREDLQRCAELVLRLDDSLAHARLASLSRQLAVSPEVADR